MGIGSGPWGCDDRGRDRVNLISKNDLELLVVDTIIDAR